jgi:hypothetical protein
MLELYLQELISKPDVNGSDILKRFFHAPPITPPVRADLPNKTAYHLYYDISP